jgi:hypothetical protein
MGHQFLADTVSNSNSDTASNSDAVPSATTCDRDASATTCNRDAVPSATTCDRVLQPVQPLPGMGHAAVSRMYAFFDSTHAASTLVNATTGAGPTADTDLYTTAGPTAVSLIVARQLPRRAGWVVYPHLL